MLPIHSDIYLRHGVPRNVSYLFLKDFWVKKKTDDAANVAPDKF